MKNYFCCILIFLISVVFADENWQNNWQEGLELYYGGKHHEAALEFDRTLSLMSEEEQNEHPYVFVYRAENNFFLGDYCTAMKDTEKALQSDKLTDFERLTCGSRRAAIFYFLNDMDAAVEEYNKYVAGCPLLTKLDFSGNKITIRNVPDCECYKITTRKRMMSKYCNDEKDIHEYGDMWIVDITKAQPNNDCADSQAAEAKVRLMPPFIKAQRTPEQLQGCYNTCSRLAVAANAICSCLNPPPQFGPIASGACKAGCFALIEEFKQECEECCREANKKCWDNFETWKEEYEKRYPGCGRPPTRCP